MISWELGPERLHITGPGLMRDQNFANNAQSRLSQMPPWSIAKLWPQWRSEPARSILRIEVEGDRPHHWRSPIISILKDLKMQDLTSTDATTSLTVLRASFLKCCHDLWRQERNLALRTDYYEVLATVGTSSWKNTPLTIN